GDFISMLVRLATASDNGDSTAAAADRTKDGESGGGGKNKKKKRKAPMQLLRPIICICNNVYAPVLRPLRQIAQSYHVHGPTATRLAQRLQEVCVREQLACDAWVLGDLARQTACDVRASLNALQLLANRTASGSKLDSASLAGAGGKDVQRSLFALWAQIFTRADAPGQPRQSPAECARAVAEAVRASGEHERLLQGCWENYLTMDLRDVTHTRVSRLLTEWLCFADTLDSASRRNPQADALHAYQEYPLVAVHLACASPLGLARTQFAYPAADYAAHQALGARTALAHTLVQGCVAPRLRASLASSSRVCGEFADYFLHVLSPTEVSTGNRHLLRGRELECAMRLVHVMEAWRLRWVQTKDAEGRFVYRLEPPVDQL
ncbi:Chromosome transmission fidelity protein 18, partial [Coemansia sp. RSA 2603]